MGIAAFHTTKVVSTLMLPLLLSVSNEHAISWCPGPWPASRPEFPSSSSSPDPLWMQLAASYQLKKGEAMGVWGSGSPALSPQICKY
jgi:hypothetical protein